MSKITGYKMMAYIDGNVCSLVQNENNYPAEIDYDIKMKGLGIWLSTKKDLVIDYYSNNTDNVEVLVTLEFDSDDITSGYLDEVEPVLTVKKATIKNIEVVEDYEVTNKFESLKTKNVKKNVTKKRKFK